MTPPQAKGETPTVAQNSITGLIVEIARLANASRSVGNMAIGESLDRTANGLLTETQQVFAETARLSDALKDIRDMPQYDQDDAHRLRHIASRALTQPAPAVEKKE